MTEEEFNEEVLKEILETAEKDGRSIFDDEDYLKTQECLNQSSMENLKAELAQSEQKLSNHKKEWAEINSRVEFLSKVQTRINEINKNMESLTPIQDFFLTNEKAIDSFNEYVITKRILDMSALSLTTHPNPKDFTPQKEHNPWSYLIRECTTANFSNIKQRLIQCSSEEQAKYHKEKYGKFSEDIKGFLNYQTNDIYRIFQSNDPVSRGVISEYNYLINDIIEDDVDWFNNFSEICKNLFGNYLELNVHNYFPLERIKTIEPDSFFQPFFSFLKKILLSLAQILYPIEQKCQKSQSIIHEIADYLLIESMELIAEFFSAKENINNSFIRSSLNFANEFDQYLEEIKIFGDLSLASRLYDLYDKYWIELEKEQLPIFLEEISGHFLEGNSTHEQDFIIVFVNSFVGLYDALPISIAEDKCIDFCNNCLTPILKSYDKHLEKMIMSNIRNPKRSVLITAAYSLSIKAHEIQIMHPYAEKFLIEASTLRKNVQNWINNLANFISSIFTTKLSDYKYLKDHYLEYMNGSVSISLLKALRDIQVDQHEIQNSLNEKIWDDFYIPTLGANIERYLYNNVKQLSFSEQNVQKQFEIDLNALENTFGFHFNQLRNLSSNNVFSRKQKYTTI